MGDFVSLSDYGRALLNQRGGWTLGEMGVGQMLPPERYDRVLDVVNRLHELAKEAHDLGFDDVASDLQDIGIAWTNTLMARESHVERSN